MTKGIGNVFLDGDFYAEVQYVLTTRRSESGLPDTRGIIKILSGNSGFNSPDEIFALELENGEMYYFWVKDPHPAIKDSRYQVVPAASPSK